jgi:hypothetical protein
MTPRGHLQSMLAPVAIVVSTTVTTVAYGDEVSGIVHPVPEYEGGDRVRPVDTSDILVPRTPAMISWVPTLYDPVSVRIRHQRDPFSRRADAIVVPFAR